MVDGVQKKDSCVSRYPFCVPDPEANSIVRKMERTSMQKEMKYIEYSRVDQGPYRSI